MSWFLSVKSQPFSWHDRLLLMKMPHPSFWKKISTPQSLMKNVYFCPDKWSMIHFIFAVSSLSQFWIIHKVLTLFFPFLYLKAYELKQVSIQKIPSSFDKIPLNIRISSAEIFGSIFSKAVQYWDEMHNTLPFCALIHFYSWQRET